MSSKDALQAIKRIAAAHGGRLPRGVQSQLARDYGLSRARVSALAREAGLKRTSGGRPSVEDSATTRKLVESGTIGQRAPDAHQRAQDHADDPGPGSASDQSPPPQPVPAQPRMRSRGA